jgi:tape measure domain-containing protein
VANHDIKVTISADGGQAVRETDKVKSALQSVSKVKASNSSMNDLAAGAKNADKEVQKLNKDVGSIPGTLAKVGAAVSAAFTVSAIIGVGKAALQAAANMELLKKGLSFTLGNSEAERLIKTIQGIGEASAYDTTQLMPMARAWVNLGDNVDTAASKIQKIVDLGSAYGLTTDEINRANTALAQMQMAGKIGAQDMMQLTNANIPAWKLLSEKMGLSVAELKEMSSQGQLTQEAMDMLFEAMAEKTGGAAESLANTLMGKFSNIEEAATNSMAAVGDIISEAFDVRGGLDALGELAQGFKTHVTNIKETMKDVGVKQAIVDELTLIDPVMGLVVDTMISGFQKIAGVISENSTAIKNLIIVIGSIMATVTVWNAVAGGISLVTNAFTAARTAALLFRTACMANPVLAALSLIVAAVVLVAANWDYLKGVANKVMSSISSFVESCCNAVKTKFQSAIDTVKNMWQGLKDFLSHPIDTLVRIQKETIESVRQSGSGYAKGGVFGMASGGLVGGLVPLANGGQLKHGTPAIVGEAGPEAVIPLRDEVLAKIGKAIADAYGVGKNNSSAISKIRMEIKSQVDTDKVSAYAKLLDDAREKAQAIGAELAKFDEFQKKANEEALEYSETGEKTVAYQQQLATLTEKIAKAQEKINNGTAGNNGQHNLDMLLAKRDNLTADYESNKNQAIQAAQEAASSRVAVEQEAQAAIDQLNQQTQEKMLSRELAVQNAKHQLELANNAESLQAYAEMMAEKDAITGESYATTLANEQLLSEMRTALYEEMMLQATDWSTYMNETLTQMAQTVQSQLSSGIANCITQGQSLASVFTNLGSTLLNTLIKNVLQKAIASLGIIKSLSQNTSKQEIANANSEAAAQGAKTGIMASNATAAVIAANPWSAAGAGALVSGQMAAARTAASAIGLATGGAVSGSGTSVSDSIPAMLSNGEYVLNADAVSRIGVPTLNMLNEGKALHFAEGGAVSSSSGSSGISRPTIQFNVSALDPASFVDLLRESYGDKIKQFLFDDSQGFASESGVFG